MGAIELALALSLVVAQYPVAEKDSPDRFSAKAAFYLQEDNGGNELIDEDAMIVETIVVLKKRITANNTATVRGMGAIISSASYDSARAHAILVSGATTAIMNPGSGGVGAGWTYHPQDWSVGIRGTIGFESAYRTRGLGLDVTRTLFDGNTTLSLMLQGYYDSVRMIRFDGSSAEEEFRTTVTSELGWTQILTPKTIGNLTASFTQQLGFLATSYAFVRIGPRESVKSDPGGLGAVDLYETAPDTRSRFSLTARLKRALDAESTLEASYRFYLDTWGINGHTANLVYGRYLFSRRLHVAPKLRLYGQTPASFYGARFDRPQRYATSDPDLGAFSGVMGGLDVKFPNVRFLLPLADYDIGINYYHRTDGIDMAWLTLGFDLVYWPWK